MTPSPSFDEAAIAKAAAQEIDNELCRLYAMNQTTDMAVASMEAIILKHLSHLASGPVEEAKELADIIHNMLCLYVPTDSANDCYQDLLTILKARLSRTPETTEWVSVEERLPEPYQTVLTWWRVGKLCQVIRDYKWHENYSVSITHWMPLPQPPATK